MDELRPESTIRDINNCLFAIRTAAYVPPKSIDDAGHTMNLQNGLFDLHTMKLREHDPDYISFVQLPVAYDSEALCPRWLEFLHETFDGLDDHAEIIAYMQEWFGYCLQRGMPHS